MSTQRLDLKSELDSLAAKAAGVWKLHACGVTRSEAPIPALVHRDWYAAPADRTRVLLVGGLSGRADEVRLALRTLELYGSAGDRLTDALTLSAVPCGNPDGLALDASPGNGVGGNPSAGYPPVDDYFFDAHDPEARYLWRWVCFQGPDLVLEVRGGSAVLWEANESASALAPSLGAGPLGPADSLLAALAQGSPNGLAPVPGLRLTASPESLGAELDRLWAALGRLAQIRPSPAHRVLDARRSRSRIEVARVLASVYGRKLEPVVYTQGVAISGRLRLARLESEGEDPVPDIVLFVAPIASGSPSGEMVRGGAGLIWGDELTEATGDPRYAGLVVALAEGYEPGVAGVPPSPSDPDFRTEDMFMNGAMLGRAFNITGERRYLDIQTRFLLDANIQQDDGLFWHSRSTPYYWGRGNGFAALGFAETLTYLPNDHPDLDALLAIHVRHLDALRRLQCPSGLYSQVVDFPGSFQELTSTCMVSYAMARGMRLGWLDSSYRESVELAWKAVSERIDEEGGLVDPCFNTGVQSSLRDYLDRPAVFGYDDRGGSMALWFATELERLHREVG